MKWLAPVLAWLIALATLAAAAHELHRQRDMAVISSALAVVPRYTLQSTPLNLVDYQSIQKKTAVFGSISLIASANALTIKAGALSDYAAWRLTIDHVLLDNPGIAWQIETLCSGFCTLDEAHQAVLSGSRISGKI